MHFLQQCLNEPVVKILVETKVLVVPLDNIQAKISGAHLTVLSLMAQFPQLIFQTFRFAIRSVCLLQQLLRNS